MRRTVPGKRPASRAFGPNQSKAKGSWPSAQIVADAFAEPVKAPDVSQAATAKRYQARIAEAAFIGSLDIVSGETDR
jgi:hypothetical protein